MGEIHKIRHLAAGIFTKDYIIYKKREINDYLTL
jgi:hypothetical protein